MAATAANYRRLPPTARHHTKGLLNFELLSRPLFEASTRAILAQWDRRTIRLAPSIAPKQPFIGGQPASQVASESVVARIQLQVSVA